MSEVSVVSLGKTSEKKCKNALEGGTGTMPIINSLTSLPPGITFHSI